MNLKEPLQTDWDTAYSGSKYRVPPPAQDGAGKAITYYGIPSSITEAQNPDEGYLTYQIDFNLVGEGVEGQTARTWVSTRPFMKRDATTGELVPVKGNPNRLGTFLRAAGLQVKPQTNSDYKAAVRAVNGKRVGFTIDWQAKNRDTQEKVYGFRSFPIDPERPNQRKAILKAGDTINEVDSKGNITGTRTVQSEVLFANIQIKYFQDPTPKVAR